MPLPVVAIVGAPNVGKSTLFNRMLGRRQAIVSDLPGVTRDRIAASCDLYGDRVTLVDTGGVVTGAADDLTRRVRAEALKAVEEADLILFVVDARAGLTALDLEVASLLRVSGKRVLTVANKIDAASLEGSEGEAHGLGLGEVVPLSAEQGRGIDELVDRLRAALQLGSSRVMSAPATMVETRVARRHARLTAGGKGRPRRRAGPGGGGGDQRGSPGGGWISRGSCTTSSS